MNRNKFFLLSLLVAIVLAALPACSSGATTTTATSVVTTTVSQAPLTVSAPPATVTVTQSPATVTTTVTATTPAMTTTAPPTTTSAPPTTTATPTTTRPLAMLPDVLDRARVPTYRYSCLIRVDEGEGAGTEVTYKTTYIAAQSAEHAWKEDASGKVTELYITIGNDKWSYTGTGWVKQAPTISLPPDVIVDLYKAVKDPETYKASVAKKIKTVVNGATSQIYEIEFTMTTGIFMPDGSIVNAEAHITGTIWIVDQQTASTILNKAAYTTEFTIQGKKTVLYTEMNVYDVDKVNETISPPM